MRLIILAFLIVLLINFPVKAQNTGRVKIKANADLAKEINIEVKYRFPQFTKGELSYISGQSANALFNYNILLNEMHYIDRKGDTLALDQEELIKQIVIANKTFYFDKERGYQELIATYNQLKLTKYEQLKIVNREKISAYGQATATGSIKTYSSINNGESSSYYKLNSNDILTLKKEVNYFLIDHNRRIIIANKTNILKFFSPHKKVIEKYLQENAINFAKAEDLHNLLHFCSQIV